VRDLFSKYESKHTFFNSRYKASHPTCLFHAMVSLEGHCKTLFVLKDYSPVERFKGPCVLVDRTIEKHTTNMHCFYMPYLQPDPQENVTFGMVTKEDYVTVFFNKDDMDINDCNRSLRSISKACAKSVIQTLMMTSSLVVPEVAVLASGLVADSGTDDHESVLTLLGTRILTSLILSLYLHLFDEFL
jgi:hypothetical protein